MTSIDFDDPDIAAYIRRLRDSHVPSQARQSTADQRRRDAAYSRTHYWRQRRPADHDFTMTLC